MSIVQDSRDFVAKPESRKNAVDGHSKKSHARVALKLTMYVVQDANSTELSLFHAGGVESIRNK